MRIEQNEQTLLVSAVAELSAANSQRFRDEVCAALPEMPDAIEIDLSETRFLDSCGLGALVSVYRAAKRSQSDVVVRLLNPSPAVQQVLELTRMHLIFEIARRRESQFSAFTSPHETNSAPVHIH